MSDCRKMKAYLTVEASLLIPFIMAALLTIVYLALYMYDRCLLYQDGWYLAIYASAYEDDPKEKESAMKNRITDIEMSHYIAWKQENWMINAEHGKATVSSAGGVVFPTAGWNLFANSDIWTIDFTESIKIHSMRNELRLYKTVEGVIK